MSEPGKPTPKARPEAQFQSRIISMARWNGWRVAHFRTAQRGDRWMTPVGADGAGFPDLVLVRGTRLIFAELKSKTGVLSPDQKQWLDMLRATCTCEVYVWKPKDEAEIYGILKK